ncbi:MAG: hypothetical protein ACLPIC_03775, partial [Rhodoblastus sp.]|uniref:hypothetical protein n=1 Tax=Rhodoblastus sp. TaxID=1962975 RepID=UPI003F9EA6C8
MDEAKALFENIEIRRTDFELPSSPSPSAEASETAKTGARALRSAAIVCGALIRRLAPAQEAH